MATSCDQWPRTAPCCRNLLRRHGGASQNPTCSYRACGRMSPPQCNQAKPHGYAVTFCSTSQSPEDHQLETVLGQEHGQCPSRIPLVPQNRAKRQDVLQVVPPEQKIPLIQSDVAVHDVLDKRWWVLNFIRSVLGPQIAKTHKKSPQVTISR